MQEEYLVKHPEQPTDLFTKDEGSYAAQKAQHEILCKLAADANLMKEFKDGKEQTAPIICTVAGVVVNGNRRLCAWRTLYYGDSKKYSHFEYVNIAIIPRECDEESIKNIERKLQIQKTLRADYKWHAKAMMMKQDQAEGTDIIELTEKYDMKNKKDTGIFLAAFDYAGEYLEKTGRAKQWSIVDGDEFSFRKFAEERKKISEQDKKELFETLVFQLIQNHSGYSGRLYDIIPDIAKNLDAIYEDMKAKMEAVETPKGETEEESEKEQSGKAEGVSTDTDNDTVINNGDGDDLDLLGGEAIETGKYAKVTKAIQNGVIDNVSEIVTNTIDNQKALQAEAKTSGFLIGQLSKASSYLQNALKQLAVNFYNDTFAIDQNACSSPKTVLWIKSDGAEGNALKDKFYKALHEVVISKYELQDSVAVDKFTQLCVDAINLNNTNNTDKANCVDSKVWTSNTTPSIKFEKGEDNLIYRIALKDNLEGVEQLESLSFKAGYFYEANLSSLEPLLKLTNTKFQTLCVYGIDKEQVIDYLIENGCTGIDRVVNIGRALDIDVNWDGFDLIRTSSREITL